MSCSASGMPRRFHDGAEPLVGVGQIAAALDVIGLDFDESLLNRHGLTERSLGLRRAADGLE